MTLLVAQIAVAVCALLLSMLFSASEAAFFLMNPDRYANAVSRSKKAAYPLKQLLTSPERMIISVLVANTTVNAIFVAVSAAIFVSFLGFEKGMLLAVFVLTAVVTVFGELFPKVFAGRYPVAVAIWTAYPVYLVYIVTTPFASFLKWISHLFYNSPVETQHRDKSASGMSYKPVDMSKGSMAHAATKSDEAITEDELRTYLHISCREGVLDEDEEWMIDSVFQLSDTFVREVMTSRTEISTVDIDASLESALEIFTECHHSRLLVTSGEKNEERGILYSKDLIPWILGKGKSTVDFSIESIMREPVFIPEVMKTDALLQEFQERHIALAIVVDEYGSTVGLVTIEDLLEELFGEIIDETDDEEDTRISGNGKNGWTIDAKLREEEVFDETGFHIPSGDFDTIGGFVFHKIGELPKVGDRVVSEGNLYIVKAMDGRRIETIELYVGDYSDKCQPELAECDDGFDDNDRSPGNCGSKGNGESKVNGGSLKSKDGAESNGSAEEQARLKENTKGGKKCLK